MGIPSDPRFLAVAARRLVHLFPSLPARDAFHKHVRARRHSQGAGADLPEAGRAQKMDNGPEMTAHALKDWCVLSGTATAYIEPGSPWQNPYVESFHSRVRDELLDVEEFSCLAEARVGSVTGARTTTSVGRTHRSGCAP
jgi:transposase InsO family protein